MTRVTDDPLAAARELAAEIASQSPDAVRGAKRLFDDRLDRAGPSRHSRSRPRSSAR